MGALTALVWAIVREVYGVGTRRAFPYYNDDLHRAGLVALVLAIGLAVYLWGLDHAQRARHGGGRPALVGRCSRSTSRRRCPGASYLLVWPLAAALVALGVAFVAASRSYRDDGRVAPAPLAVLLAGAAPGAAARRARPCTCCSWPAACASSSSSCASGSCSACWCRTCRWSAYPRRWPLPAALGRRRRGPLHRPQSRHRLRRRLAAHRQPVLPRSTTSAGSASWGTLDEVPDAWTGRVLGAPGRWDGRPRARAAVALRPLLTWRRPAGARLRRRHSRSSRTPCAAAAAS